MKNTCVYNNKAANLSEFRIVQLLAMIDKSYS